MLIEEDAGAAALAGESGHGKTVIWRKPLAEQKPAQLDERIRRQEQRIAVPGGRAGQVLTRRFGRPHGAAWEAAGDILQATATADLTLTTTAQSITGDGDTSKVRLLLPTPGDWLIEASVDLYISVAGAGTCIGQLHVNDSATAETAQALLEQAAVRATVPQRWKITTTVANTPVELKARKDLAGGTAQCMGTHTRLTASTGTGGGAGGGAGGEVRFSYSITVENPSNAEDITIGFTNRAITVTEMRAVLIGSLTPSVTWTVRHHATDRSNIGNEVVVGGTITISTTSGSDVTSFNNPNILVDSFIWLKTTAKSGTVNELHVTIIGTID